MSESAEGARLLSEYTSLNLYRGFKSLSLRHQERNSSLCMTLTVCKDCFFYSLKCLHPSRVFSAFPLHTALFYGIFYGIFDLGGRPFRSRPQKRSCTGVLYNGLTSSFEPSIRDQGRGLRVPTTGRPSPGPGSSLRPGKDTRDMMFHVKQHGPKNPRPARKRVLQTQGSHVFSLRLHHILLHHAG